MVNAGLRFTLQPDGNLKLELTPEGREELIEMTADQKDDNTKWWELIEQDACNGGYQMVRPEWVGALTEAPMVALTDELVFPDQGTPHLLSSTSPIYYHPFYMVEDPFQVLLEKGEIMFRCHIGGRTVDEIIIRKMDGIDCDENESGTIKQYIKKELLAKNIFLKGLDKHFPCEVPEAFEEYEADRLESLRSRRLTFRHR